MTFCHVDSSLDSTIQSIRQSALEVQSFCNLFLRIILRFMYLTPNYLFTKEK